MGSVDGSGDGPLVRVEPNLGSIESMPCRGIVRPVRTPPIDLPRQNPRHVTVPHHVCLFFQLDTFVFPPFIGSIKEDSSISVACWENSAKFTPVSFHMAPRGEGAPVRTLMLGSPMLSLPAVRSALSRAGNNHVTVLWGQQ